MKKQNIAMFPGTFSPLHDGHINIVNRASKLFDLLYIVVSHNIYKKDSIDLNLRFEEVKSKIESLNLTNVIVSKNDGLTIDFAKQNCCKYIVRSARNDKDFDYEFTMAQVNYFLNNDIETILFIADDQLKNISSSSTKMLNDNVRELKSGIRCRN